MLIFGCVFLLGILSIARMQGDIWNQLSVILVIPSLMVFYIFAIDEKSGTAGLIVGLLSIIGYFLILTAITYLTVRKHKGTKRYFQKYILWFVIYWITAILISGLIILGYLFFFEPVRGEYAGKCVSTLPFTCQEYLAIAGDESADVTIGINYYGADTLRIKNITIKESSTEVECSLQQENAAITNESGIRTYCALPVQRKAGEYLKAQLNITYSYLSNDTISSFETKVYTRYEERALIR